MSIGSNNTADDLPSFQTDRRIGRRIIRAGDVVKILGLGRARVRVIGGDGPRSARGFRVLGFRGEQVIVVGSLRSGRVEDVHTYSTDRIGARPLRNQF